MLSILLTYYPKMQYSYQTNISYYFQNYEGQTSFMQREMKCFVFWLCINNINSMLFLLFLLRPSTIPHFTMFTIVIPCLLSHAFLTKQGYF